MAATGIISFRIHHTARGCCVTVYKGSSCFYCKRHTFHQCFLSMLSDESKWRYAMREVASDASAFPFVSDAVLPTSLIEVFLASNYYV